jgi:hypothetical protein
MFRELVDAVEHLVDFAVHKQNNKHIRARQRQTNTHRKEGDSQPDRKRKMLGVKDRESIGGGSAQRA